MSKISLLDGTIKLSIFYDSSDREFEDDICFCFEEDCPENEKLFKADETSFNITPEQAALIVLELNRAIKEHRADLPNTGE
jgi:hypothetical protein